MLPHAQCYFFTPIRRDLELLESSVSFLEPSCTLRHWPSWYVLCLGLNARSGFFKIRVIIILYSYLTVVLNNFFDSSSNSNVHSSYNYYYYYYYSSSYFQFDTAKSYQNEKCQVHAILSLASQLSQWSCLGDLRSHSFRPLHFGKFSMN